MQREQSSHFSQSITLSERATHKGSSQVTFLDRWMTRNLLAAIDNPPVSFRLWNNEDISPEGCKPQFVLKAMVIAVRQALDYVSTWRAVGVCVIGWIVQTILLVLLFTFLGGCHTASLTQNKEGTESVRSYLSQYD